MKLYYVEKCVDCGAYVSKTVISENHPYVDIPLLMENCYKVTPEEFEDRWNRPACNLKQGFKHAGSTGIYVTVL